MLVDVALLLATGLCAGAAVYVSLVEHPARVAGGTALVGAEFRPSSRRGAVMRASLAALAAVAGIGDWARGHGALPLPAGLVALLPVGLHQAGTS
jgi:hypothetical protein